MELKGVFTAIITPFEEDGSVDEQALRKLVDLQVAAGVAGIVPCGTTGESPTLSDEEHNRVIDIVIDQAKGNVLVIAGTGSNNTAKAIEWTRHAKEAGADAVLVVNPYYNKPTQEGLFRHFKAIADTVDIPCVVYNIKGRTGVNLETATLKRIVDACPNVIAVKEASGDLNQMKDVIATLPEDFKVLSGDDNMTLELIKAGGKGVISVASNLVPKEMVDMVYAAMDGNMEKAEELNSKLERLFEVEFIETNPIPIKAALAMKGLCKEIYRLPMCELSKEHREELEKELKEIL